MQEDWSRGWRGRESCLVEGIGPRDLRVRLWGGDVREEPVQASRDAALGDGRECAGAGEAEARGQQHGRARHARQPQPYGAGKRVRGGGGRGRRVMRRGRQGEGEEEGEEGGKRELGMRTHRRGAGRWRWR